MLYKSVGIPASFGSVLAIGNPETALRTLETLVAYLFVASLVVIALSLGVTGWKRIAAAFILHLQLVSIPSALAYLLSTLQHSFKERAEVICIWGFFSAGIVCSLLLSQLTLRSSSQGVN